MPAEDEKRIIFLSPSKKIFFVFKNLSVFQKLKSKVQGITLIFLFLNIILFDAIFANHLLIATGWISLG